MITRPSIRLYRIKPGHILLFGQKVKEMNLFIDIGGYFPKPTLRRKLFTEVSPIPKLEFYNRSK